MHKRILSNVDHLAAELSDYAAGIVGVVRLWANTSAIMQFLPARDRCLRRDESGHPHRARGAGQYRSRAWRCWTGGRTSASLPIARRRSGCRSWTYREDRLVLVVPKGHPLASRKAIHFDEALDFDFVSLSEGTSLAQRLQLETEALGKRLKLRIQVRSFDAMCQMVAAGLGVAVLPDAAIQPHLRSMGLRKIDLRDAWVHRQPADRRARL